MTAEFQNNGILVRNILRGLRPIVDELIIQSTEQGLYIQQIARDDSMYIEILISKDDMSAYYPNNKSIKVKMYQLYDILKNIKKSDSCNLIIDTRLTIEIINDSGCRTFFLGDFLEKHLNNDDSIDFTSYNSCEIKSMSLLRVAKDLKDTRSSLTVTDKNVTFSTPLYKATVSCTSESGISFLHKYSIDSNSLGIVSKFFTLNVSVQIYSKDKAPLVIKYSLPSEKDTPKINSYASFGFKM